jgi:hypothetical protein
MRTLQPATTGFSPNIPHIPLHNWGVAGQIGSVFTHQIISEFVKKEWGKGALGPADFAMAARLTREVDRSQARSKVTENA